MPGPDQPPTNPALRADRTIHFLRRCQRRLSEVAADDEAGAPAVEGAAALAAAIDRAAEAGPIDAAAPSWLPVLDSLAELAREEHVGVEAVGAGVDRPAAAPDPSLTADLIALAPDLSWIPTHRATDGGTELALAPLDRVIELGDTIVGLMYVGPGATYPLHQHPPQELYLTIAGQGRWRYGGNDHFESVGPDRTLYNRPGDLHSAIAGPLPVVALYVLW